MEVKIIGQMDNTIDHTFESANRVYDTNGISPTVNTCGGGDLQPKVLEISKVIGGFGEKKSNNGTQWYQQDRVYDMGDIAMCHPTNISGGSYNYLEVKKMEKIEQIVAMRGRNPDNPKSREVGLLTEQMLEPNKDNISNCVTTVQKDNLIMETKEIENPLKNMDGAGWHFAQNVYNENTKCIRSVKVGGGSGNIPKMISIKQATKEGSIPMEIGGVFDGSFPSSKTRRGRVQENGNVCPTITAQNQELYRLEICECNQPGAVLLHLKDDDSYYMVRIRKLTPRECLRLMSVKDDEITRILETNSKTQAYKQAGNSIVVDCMTAMFSQLGIKGVEKWNDKYGR